MTDEYTPEINGSSHNSKEQKTIKDNPEEFMKWLDSFADAAAQADFDDDEPKSSK